MFKMGRHIFFPCSALNLHNASVHIPVAVAAHGAAGLSAAPLRAPVIVDLGAGAAGAGAVLPEVVLLAELEDAILGDADLLVPDAERLVVGGCGLVASENRGIQAVRVEADPLGARQEFPRPVDGLGLEIVAEREVAEHFIFRTDCWNFFDSLCVSLPSVFSKELIAELK